VILSFPARSRACLAGSSRRSRCVQLSPWLRSRGERFSRSLPRRDADLAKFLGLSIDDVDFEQRSAWYSHLISPKSNRSVATVPMPGPLAEVLTNYLATWRPNEKRLLFSNRRDNPYSENKVVRKGSGRFWTCFQFLAVGCTHSGMGTEAPCIRAVRR
jgi:hypothetical protein